MQVTFAGYCLDLGTRQLLHGTAEVHLSPKALDLLQVLVDNRTRAVSKAELHDRGTFLRKGRITQTASLADLDELQVESVQLTVRILSGDVATQTVDDR